MRLARTFVTFVAVLAFTVALPNQALAYETTTSSASWGHWTYGPPFQFISWTDNYTGYFDWRDYTGYHLDKLIWQNTQGGCIGPSNLNQGVNGYVTYYWPGGSRGPVYSAFAQGIGCANYYWGGAQVSVFPNVLFLSTDSYKYAQVCTTWFGAGASPNSFGECRTHNY